MDKEIKYIDCHSHPQDPKFAGDENFLIELEKDGGATIAIGTDYYNCMQVIDLAKRHDNVWCTIGIHPADNHMEIYDENKFEELLRSGGDKVVGVGECGLDYYYFESNLKKNPEFDIEKEKMRQKDIFIRQIEFAQGNDLALVLHGRPTKNSMDAYRDMLDILERYKGLKGHAHFFVGNLEIAERFLKLGFLMSFDGPITFTSEYDSVIKFLPIENIMIETDSPYAAPMPYRGKLNYPQYVKFVAKRVGELKGLTEEEVLEKTLENTKKLFSLKF